MASVDPLIQALIDARHAQRLSVRRLAARAGLSPDSIANWEQGRYNPHYGALRCWANGLGLTITIAGKDAA